MLLLFLIGYVLVLMVNYKSRKPEPRLRIKLGGVRVLLLLCLCTELFGQTSEIDSLRKVVKERAYDKGARRAAVTRLLELFNSRREGDSMLSYARRYADVLPDISNAQSLDSAIIMHLVYLGGAYQFHKADSAIFFSSKALEAARQTGFVGGEARALQALGENHRLRGDLPMALDHFFSSLRISKEIHDAELEASCNVFIGIAFIDLGENRTGLSYLWRGLASNDSIFHGSTMVPFAYSNISNAYRNLGMLDSTEYFLQKAESIRSRFGWKMSSLSSDIVIKFGNLHVQQKEYKKALECFRAAMKIGDYLNLPISQYYQADLLHRLNQPDSGLYFAKLAYRNSRDSKQMNWIVESSRLLAKFYSERKMTDSAFCYLQIALALRDSLYSPQNFKKLQLNAVKEQQIQYETLRKKEQAEQEKTAVINKVRTYGLLSVVLVSSLIAMVLFKNNRQKQKANRKLEAALSNLKSTQSQLIHSEKMASLGELTAGIAHEIQNPLNFVNNFSEVNEELASELEQAAAKGSLEEVRSLASTILENEKKIAHHGKRADSIVKSMLQHSRTSSGQKELTNMNALCEEYLRLAYHGFRARDKSFNASFRTNFDPSLPTVDIVQQEMGRVLLNLINNAFYAVNEKFKADDGTYEPTVTVATRKLDGKVEISVKDNGNGIPPPIKDKIFQPFFTTKPTGHGTGLGLSLSYDIVKAIGGDLRVETIEGAGSEFIIQLPI